MYGTPLCLIEFLNVPVNTPNFKTFLFSWPASLLMILLVLFVFNVQTVILINVFLGQAVMQDEKMIHSETLYAFFAPSPQFLHQPSTQRRNKFSVSMFKRRWIFQAEGSCLRYAMNGRRVTQCLGLPLFRKFVDFREMITWETAFIFLRFASDCTI